MTEMDKVYRAQRARELLDDPVLAETFQAIERTLIEEMLDTSISDDDRRRWSDRVNAVRAVRDTLKQMVEAGKERPEPPKLP